MKVTDVIEPDTGHIGKWAIGTFDIETRSDIGESALLGKFVLGATCRDARGETVQFHDTMVGILFEILKYQDKVRWFCHNGGNFDFKYFITDANCLLLIKERGFRIDVIGGKIAKGLMLKKGKKTILVCDSFKLMNMSLAKLTAGLKVDCLKGHINFDIEDFDETNQLHLDYLRDDVKSLWQVVAKYRDIITTEFGTDIKCTASSTAFSCWKTTITDKVFKHNEKCNLFARLAYYGGRTECFYQGTAHDVSYIDVNSLYAFIMRDYGGLHRPFYTTDYAGPGFYRIDCVVPTDCKFGPLPYRKPDGSGVLFPVGRFSTHASSLEIDLARELGAIVTIHEGFAFDVWNKDLFKPFIEKCVSLRQRDYCGALGLAAKFLQNNLYGFFGMSPLRSELIFSFEEPEEGDFTPVVDSRTGEQIETLWERDRIQDSINCIPAFAAWITAGARVHLLRAMVAEELAGNTVLYCDTDSVLMTGSPISRIAEGEYGAFKLEYIFDTFQPVTGKTYRGVSAGNETLRCKGIPAKKLTAAHFDMALNDNGQRGLLDTRPLIEYVQLFSLSRVARNGTLGNNSANRHMPGVASMTTRTAGKGGFTNPINLFE